MHGGYVSQDNGKMGWPYIATVVQSYMYHITVLNCQNDTMHRKLDEV